MNKNVYECKKNSFILRLLNGVSGLILVIPALFIFSGCSEKEEASPARFTYETRIDFQEDKIGLFEWELLESLKTMFSGGEISWMVGKSGEVVVQEYTLMGNPFKMTEEWNEKTAEHNTYFSFLDEKLRMIRPMEEAKEKWNEIQAQVEVIEDRTRQKDFFGLGGHFAEAFYIENGDEIKISAYICRNYPMRLSFLQGLDYNPFDGAILYAEVQLGSLEIFYELKDYEPFPEDELFMKAERNEYRVIDSEWGSFFENILDF